MNGSKSAKTGVVVKLAALVGIVGSVAALITYAGTIKTEWQKLMSSATPNSVSAGEPWQIDSKSKFVVILEDPAAKVRIRYVEGDGPTVGIDNSNDIDPGRGNFRFVHKGNSAEFRIESGPNLGIFLVGSATYARGTYVRIP